MSGVYIKDLEMPKTCGECLLYHLRPPGESYCAYNLFTVADHERPFDCPLSEYPIRHGKWTRRFDTRFTPELNDIVICSECGIAYSTGILSRRSYCPNCGAKMDEEEIEHEID